MSTAARGADPAVRCSRWIRFRTVEEGVVGTFRRMNVLCWSVGRIDLPRGAGRWIDIIPKAENFRSVPGSDIPFRCGCYRRAALQLSVPIGLAQLSIPAQPGLASPVTLDRLVSAVHMMRHPGKIVRFTHSCRKIAQQEYKKHWMESSSIFFTTTPRVCICMIEVSISHGQQYTLLATRSSGVR